MRGSRGSLSSRSVSPLRTGTAGKSMRKKSKGGTPGTGDEKRGRGGTPSAASRFRQVPSKGRKLWMDLRDITRFASGSTSAAVGVTVTREEAAAAASAAASVRGFRSVRMAVIASLSKVAELETAARRASSQRGGLTVEELPSGSSA